MFDWDHVWLGALIGGIIGGASTFFRKPDPEPEAAPALPVVPPALRADNAPESVASVELVWQYVQPLFAWVSASVAAPGGSAQIERHPLPGLPFWAYLAWSGASGARLLLGIEIQLQGPLAQLNAFLLGADMRVLLAGPTTTFALPNEPALRQWLDAYRTFLIEQLPAIQRQVQALR